MKRLFKHITQDINNKEDLLEVIKLFKKHKPIEVAFDTETTGLNIGIDIPFLFQFGWMHEGTVYSFAVDIEKNPELGNNTIWSVFNLVKKIPVFMGHNIKYDLHMCHNLGFDYDTNNVTDTQIYIRLAHDALTPANGGPPLGLKEYSTQYIDRSAKDHERLLKTERTSIAKAYNAVLLKSFRSCPNPPAGYKSWTKGALEELFKDILATPDTLPTQEMRELYHEWYKTIPENIKKNMKTVFVESSDVPYDMLDRETVIRYGHKDIYYTLAVYYKTKPVLEVRKQTVALQLENACILPLKTMERVGFNIDKRYVLQSRIKMSEYIKQRRDDLFNLVHEEVRVGQHARIKQLLADKWGVRVHSTGTTELNRLVPRLKDEGYTEAVDFINIVQELRTLEKWYSTYLLRFINELKRSDRIYTQINQVGTVSGRVTSDFQQFPRSGIKTNTGEELFNPRLMVTKSKDSIGLAYLDYSQIELRLQAMYTILVGHPDLNLCRAYMPYKCYTNDVNGEMDFNGLESSVVFDYNKHEHLTHSYDWNWYHEEDGTPWHPLDVHGATAKVAFPDITEDHPDWKKYRSIGKTTNFAKNYGAQLNRIREMFPDFDEETCIRIDQAYYTAFPGVKAYHQYCYELASAQPYATNLFGVRYYNLTGHKLINTLIQGSGAYFLKIKMTEVHNYLKENNYKTKFQMNIHDELSFELAEGEEHILFEIQTIMQSYPETLVPIVADIEVSKTAWAEKKDASTLEDVKAILS